MIGSIGLAITMYFFYGDDFGLLMQVAQAGESARDAALMLIHIHRREAVQRERMNARFANRTKSTASADFDLPASNDNS